jgi:hypothetical protein
MLRNEEYLRETCPAIFATAPEEGRVSDRYSFLSTEEILNHFQDEGWEVASASQVKTRTWSREHARHLVRLRHESSFEREFGVGDSVPEIVMINAHNGLAGHTVKAGIFRFVCSNGMIVSEQEFGDIYFRHVGFDASQVREASDAMLAKTTEISQIVTDWQDIQLDFGRTRNFVQRAAELRFDEADDDLLLQLDKPRRPADEGHNLWKTFNRVQENLTKGGFTKQATGRKVREITNIQLDVDLNARLWDLAATVAQE